MTEKIKKLLRHPLFWIFVLALTLRLYKLGEFPVGFHADEVRVGWQASLGKLLPLYYNTFGDYRPTGIFYTVMPSLLVFGKNEFAVRFPSALFGALSILPLFLITKQISKRDRLGLIAGFLLAISPWHIAVSRATSEAVIAIFLTLLALYFFLNLIKTDNKKYLIYTLGLTFISYLFYHSTRVLSPIFFIITAYCLKTSKGVVRTVIVGAILITVIFAMSPAARGRLSQVSIFSDIDVKYEVANANDLVNNSLVIYTKRFINEYAKYFSPDYLIGYQARPYRYITPGVGILTFVEAFLFVLGLIQIAKKKAPILPLLLLLVSPLPAALTTEDSPNLMRSIYMVPFIVIISSYGFYALGKFKKTIFTFLIFNLIFFVYMYFNHSYIHRPFIANSDMDASSFRNVGSKELVLKLDKQKDDYGKIVVTGFPDNIKPWYEFFVGEVPKNILLTDLKCASDDIFLSDDTQKLLAVDSWQCSPEAKIKDGLPIKIVEKILRNDGSEVFSLITRED